MGATIVKGGIKLSRKETNMSKRIKRIFLTSFFKTLNTPFIFSYIVSLTPLFAFSYFPNLTRSHSPEIISLNGAEKRETNRTKVQLTSRKRRIVKKKIKIEVKIIEAPDPSAK